MGKLSYGQIRAIGITTIVGVAGLTAFAVNMVIADANRRADEAYALSLANFNYPERVITLEEPVTELETEPVTEPETEPVTEPETVAEPETEPVIEDQNPDLGNEVPEDLGYDLLHVTISEDGNVVYIIQPGDMLSRIGLTFGFTVDELAKANPYITNVNLIYPNNIVVLPVNDEFAEYAKYYLGQTTGDDIEEMTSGNTSSTDSSPVTSTIEEDVTDAS